MFTTQPISNEASNEKDDVEEEEEEEEEEAHTNKGEDGSIRSARGRGGKHILTARSVRLSLSLPRSRVGSPAGAHTLPSPDRSRRPLRLVTGWRERRRLLKDITFNNRVTFPESRASELVIDHDQHRAR